MVFLAFEVVQTFESTSRPFSGFNSLLFQTYNLRTVSKVYVVFCDWIQIGLKRQICRSAFCSARAV